MKITVEKLPKSEVKISVSLELPDFQNDLLKAASRLSETATIEGFRPGKAPYERVVAKFGEMAIWNEAIEEIVRRHYVSAVIDNHLAPIGSPSIDLIKFAPGNPIEFSATIAVLPDVIALPDLKSIKITKKPLSVDDKNVAAALQELQKLQTQEVEIDQPASRADKVVINLAILKDQVAIEGGTTKNHSVYLSEPYYIPGFVDELLGLKKGDKKTFTLKFPDEHYQKNLAGQNADFSVEVTQIYALKPPALDDEFAKRLGQNSLIALRELIEKNLLEEAGRREKEREETEALEKLVEKTAFGEIPDKLIDSETEKMAHELEHSVAAQGLEFNIYLNNLGKTRDQLKLDFAAQAIKRVKTILALGALGRREGVIVPESEVASEIERTMNMYKDDPETQKEIRTESYADRVRNVLLNKKIIEFLLNAVTVEEKALR